MGEKCGSSGCAWCLYVAMLMGLLPSGRVGADEQRWELTAKFVSLREGREDIAIFELADASRVEVPLSALSEASRRDIAALARGDAVPDRDRAEAAKMVRHAVELLRLGNSQLAKQELQKASKADPTSGDADFVAALVYAIEARNNEKAVDHFAEVVKRQPRNAAAWANLALCELHTKQYSKAVAHFRRAIELKPDGQAIVDNMALAIRAAGAGQARITDKVLADLNDLYRTSLSGLKLSGPAPVPGQFLIFHGLDGKPVDPKSQTMLFDAIVLPLAPPETVPEKPAESASQPAAGVGAESPQPAR